MSQRPKVIILGAGFAGLDCASELAKNPIDILLVDKNNFHTFTPLIYQVATCALDPSNVAYPVRSIIRDKHNISFLLGDVVGIDTLKKEIQIQTHHAHLTEPYDILLVATGSVTNFYGNASLERFAFGLKTLEDAVNLRNHILALFEQAAWESDLIEKNALISLVVIGGGPTGLETAGALYELYNHVLKHEYQDRPDLKAKVYLLEASDRLLQVYPEELQIAAKEQLESLGVEVRLNAKVQDISEDQVSLADGTVIASHTVVWSAGVKASSLSAMLNVENPANNRIPVNVYMQVKGYETVFAAGDIAYLQDEKGQAYPMLIPVAKQQGKLAAQNIVRLLGQEPLLTFQYSDRGIMATVGRSRAVAWIFYRFKLTGFIAWLAWLFLHLIALVGFRNRAVVFINWLWNYISYDRSVRLILRPQPKRINKPEQIKDPDTIES